MQVTLNIGLRRNSGYTANRDMISINDLKEGIGILEGIILTRFEIREHMGEWNGEPEPTAVIRFYADKNLDLASWITYWARVYGQECIAAQMGSQGVLVYNPLHDGDQMDFDTNYFINY